jgi:LmbE family N-acetylglucosaminyl deacetylase
MTNKVLIVVAHSDDESLGMGGTISKHVNNGDDVFVISMTDGVGSRENVKPVFIEERNFAAKNASKILGFEWFKLNNFPDNKLDSVPILNVIKEIEKAKLDLKPNLIYTHSSSDLNIDHRIVCQSVLTAFRPQPNEEFEEIRTFEIPSSTDYGHKSVTDIFCPNLYVNIEFFIENKINALKQYDLELRNEPHPRSIESVKNLAKYRGSQVGLFYAESFEVLRKIVR